MISRTRISALAVLILFGVAAPAAARSRTIRVPHLSGDVTRAYATLHRDGLRVSIAHSFTVRSDQITTVTRTAPATGRRVRRGSVVTLTVRCCTRLRHPVTTGSHASTVPTFGGYPLLTARGWSLAYQRRLLAHLSPLRGAGQPTLLANYVVSRQSPAAGSTLAGAAQLRLSGRPGRAAACLPPLYGRVVAKDDLAEVSSVTESNLRQGELVPGVIYSGCVYSRNQPTALTTTYTRGNADLSLSTPVLAGTEVTR